MPGTALSFDCIWIFACLCTLAGWQPRAKNECAAGSLCARGFVARTCVTWVVARRALIRSPPLPRIRPQACPGMAMVQVSSTSGCWPSTSPASAAFCAAFATGSRKISCTTSLSRDKQSKGIVCVSCQPCMAASSGELRWGASADAADTLPTKSAGNPWLRI